MTGPYIFVSYQICFALGCKIFLEFYFKKILVVKSEYATKWRQFFLVWSLSMRDILLSRIYTSTTSERCLCKRRWEKMEKLISRVILCGYYFTTTLHGICLSIYISRLLKSVCIKHSLLTFHAIGSSSLDFVYYHEPKPLTIISYSLIYT